MGCETVNTETGQTRDHDYVLFLKDGEQVAVAAAVVSRHEARTNGEGEREVEEVRGNVKWNNRTLIKE